MTTSNANKSDMDDLCSSMFFGGEHGFLRSLVLGLIQERFSTWTMGEEDCSFDGMEYSIMISNGSETRKASARYYDDKKDVLLAAWYY